MKGAWHLAIALQFSYVAKIDQHDIVAVCKFDGLFDRQGLDLALRGLAQGLVSSRNGLRHGFSPSRPMLAEPFPALNHSS